MGWNHHEKGSTENLRIGSTWPWNPQFMASFETRKRKINVNNNHSPYRSMFRLMMQKWRRRLLSTIACRILPGKSISIIMGDVNATESHRINHFFTVIPQLKMLPGPCKNVARD